jgi:hypothetical protein
LGLADSRRFRDRLAGQIARPLVQRQAGWQAQLGQIRRFDLVDRIAIFARRMGMGIRRRTDQHHATAIRADQDLADHRRIAHLQPLLTRGAENRELFHIRPILTGNHHPFARHLSNYSPDQPSRSSVN